MNNLSDIVSQCMHCGLCLPVCPTYSLTKNETSSPRGRIRLVKGVLAGEIPVSANVDREMHFCLGCYACMSACPAGVQYDEILETGRGFKPPAWWKKALLRFFFASKARLHFFARIARLARPLLALSPLAPVPEKQFTRQLLPAVVPARGPLRARVALFTGCVMDVASASIHADSAEVLSRNGCEVHLVAAEECCGALLGHAGDHEGAKQLAQKNVAAFQHLPSPAPKLDGLVVNAAGCGAYLKKYPSLLGETAREFSAKVWDIQEFLDKLGLAETPGPIHGKVVIQEPCHLTHGQKVSGQVSSLLKKIPGLEVVPLEGGKDCCGSAGIYNITHHEDSMKLLDAKMDRVAQTGADMLAAANPGCLFQLQYGMKRRGLAMKVLHPMSLLAKAYRGERI